MLHMASKSCLKCILPGDITGEHVSYRIYELLVHDVDLDKDIEMAEVQKERMVAFSGRRRRLYHHRHGTQLTSLSEFIHGWVGLGLLTD